MEIENEFLIVGVDLHGGALTRIYDKTKKKELLYDAKGIWKFADHIIFPTIGGNNSFAIDGKDYKIPTNHGFGRTSDFEVKEKGAGYLLLQIEDNDFTRSVYPFSFRLEVSYRLQGRKLIRGAKVFHEGSPMPFQFGTHPAFIADLDHAIFHFQPNTNLYVLEDKVKVSKKEPLPFPLEWHVNRKDIAISDTIVIDNPGGDLMLENGFGDSIVFHYHSPYIAIWTPAKKDPDDFLAVEPWYGLCPYLNMPAELGKRLDVQWVSGEKDYQDELDF